MSELMKLLTHEEGQIEGYEKSRLEYEEDAKKRAQGRFGKFKGCFTKVFGVHPTKDKIMDIIEEDAHKENERIDNEEYSEVNKVVENLLEENVDREQANVEKEFERIEQENADYTKGKTKMEKIKIFEDYLVLHNIIKKKVQALEKALKSIEEGQLRIFDDASISTLPHKKLFQELKEQNDIIMEWYSFQRNPHESHFGFLSNDEIVKKVDEATSKKKDILGKLSEKKSDFIKEHDKLADLFAKCEEKIRKMFDEMGAGFKRKFYEAVVQNYVAKLLKDEKVVDFCRSIMGEKIDGEESFEKFKKTVEFVVRKNLGLIYEGDGQIQALNLRMLFKNAAEDYRK